MKRLALVVVALVLVFCTTVIAENKYTTTPLKNTAVVNNNLADTKSVTPDDKLKTQKNKISDTKSVTPDDKLNK